MIDQPLLDTNCPAVYNWQERCFVEYQHLGSDWFYGFSEWIHRMAELENCEIEAMSEKQYLKFRTDRDLTLFLLKYS